MEDARGRMGSALTALELGSAILATLLGTAEMMNLVSGLLATPGWTMEGGRWVSLTPRLLAIDFFFPILCALVTASTYAHARLRSGTGLAGLWIMVVIFSLVALLGTLMVGGELFRYALWLTAVAAIAGTIRGLVEVRPPPRGAG